MGASLAGRMECVHPTFGGSGFEASRLPCEQRLRARPVVGGGPRVLRALAASNGGRSTKPSRAREPDAGGYGVAGTGSHGSGQLRTVG
jgi:hypothetical protein